MNHKQREIIQWGAGVIVLMLLCPPWRGSGFEGYSPIFAPPPNSEKIAFDVMAVQIAAALTLMGVAVFSYASPKDKDDKE